jgi:glycosyltransferase involved in cell wall biosynthesis
MHPVAPDPALRQGARVVLGYVGVTGYQDEIDYLLQALAILRGELGVDGVRCLIMGDGEALPSRREQSRALGLDEDVSFTGWPSDAELRQHVSSIDIGVVPGPSNA